MPSAWSGMNWIAGGAVAAILLPVLAIGIGMPFWIAGIISVATGGGLVFLLSPRKLFEGLDASGAARGKIAFARELLTSAEPLAIRLEVAVSTIRTQAVAERVRNLARISREIFAGVEEDPLRVDRVRRFLTYYLPRAADLAEAYAVLEKSGNRDTRRLVETGDLIERLDTAFSHYATNLQEADLGNLDIELKLLKSSLDEDLGAAQLPVSDPSKRRA
ncbi:5-bromo-4-chloroindolyl phosphate hydrolysis family protein [Bradyrhizobium sp. WSM 1738]|uniref:5-bromo-4-chloroindolyl phosphate hydrolysis family protein n=1 Tax=Bradyrhizobium hereditatis TaxID=2821405 RepID=UPI001CE32C19|nr:5-bromo-4-chloroindolyl phosphate hydrolysis family protein [Bradyrhizobium hereditatis]MCA6115428.1 5-bromo-4-chloroindolyl phosphate hydrolysis family protein [Bradyrhizobium hereditatis]